MRNLLKNFLGECPLCQKYFIDNIALFVDGDQTVLSDEEAGDILIALNDYHRDHDYEEAEVMK